MYNINRLIINIEKFFCCFMSSAYFSVACYFMRTLYTSLFLLFLTNTFGQVTVDTSLQRQYDEALRALPYRVQELVTEAEKDTSFQGGFVILTDYGTDTLNKEEHKQSSVKIIVIDVPTNHKKAKQKTRPAVIENNSGYNLLFCGAKMYGDTLTLTIGAPFSDETIQQKIFHSTVLSTYNETHGGDTIFWSDKSEMKTADLTITANTLKIAVSSSDDTSGNVLYGYSEIETEPYYTEAVNFKNRYIKKRLHFKYYFKCRLSKNST